jgi:probable addiction module antidote protein
MVEVSKFDAAEYLKTPEMIAVYLTDAFETDDPVFISLAIGTAARAKGMAEVAKAAGVSRESLYKSLNGQSKPEFDTVRRVLTALGIKLVAEPISDSEAALCVSGTNVA